MPVPAGRNSLVDQRGGAIQVGEIGSLAIGRVADVSVLHDDRGRFLLRDNDKNEVVAERLLRPAFCLRAGRRFDADAPILPAAVAA